MGKKVLLGAIAVLVIGIGVLFWWNTGLREDVAEYAANNAQLRSANENNQEELFRLRQQQKIQDELNQRYKQKQREIEERARELSEELQNERENNKDLQDCWNVPLGDYAERLRDFSGKTSGKDQD